QETEGRGPDGWIGRPSSFFWACISDAPGDLPHGPYGDRPAPVGQFQRFGCREIMYGGTGLTGQERRRHG
ncbi:MAG: hypothetical protein OEU25_20805, partial [Rhodospirillales bacterium]|nr:hypothetical protein [Rhodospirillales bacterium]